MDERRKEFLRFEHNNMTITEYEKKFTKLAKYAMTFVVDGENNCRCFEQGLRMTIRIPVTTSMN